MPRIGRAIFVWLILPIAFARAAGGLDSAPAWERQPAKQFHTQEGILLADGKPMPLLYEFTWSAPHDADFFHYFSQFLGNSHWESLSLNLNQAPNWSYIDNIYAMAAREKIYVTLCPSVQHCFYKDEASFAVAADGKPASRNTRSFMHEGYRHALARSLTRLAKHVADKPYHLGWYPQDEYAYRAFSGYEESSLEAFRQWVIEKHGNLDALNRAWGSNFAQVEAIDPPRKFERSVRFADWQEFRRWAQTDFTRFVYQTIKRADPKGVVIWSLPFWGNWRDCAGWWDMAQYSDVLMRHGIGYKTGIYRFTMIRDVAHWAGKPANALCMPPDYNPTYVQMGFLFEGPRTGLSHVCPGGSDEHTYYSGAADSERGYKRREPMYTASRSLNDLVRYLGDTFLLSQQPPREVGVFVSDRTVLVNGTDLNALNGILLLLSDLNIDYEIFAEPSLGDLSRFDAIFAGQYAQCSTPEIAEQFADFARGGGLLILTRGAFTADWYNLPQKSHPAFALASLVGSAEVDERPLRAPLKVVAGNENLPSRLPVLGQVSLRRLRGAKVIAETEAGAPVITRLDNVVFFGVDPGLVYQKGYTDDFAGVAQRKDKQVIDEFAGFEFEPTRAEEQSIALQEHRAYGQLVRALLSERGIEPAVQVDGPGRAIGAIRARALFHENNVVVGIANRVVLPGRDHQKDPPELYHHIHRNLTVRVATDTHPTFAVQMPLARVNDLAVSAMPEKLSLSSDGNLAKLILPELADVACVVLTDDYPPLLGVELERRALTAPSEFIVRGRVLNASPRRINGKVWLEASPPLNVSTPSQNVTVEPSQYVNIEFKGMAAKETPTGYYLVQIVGDFGQNNLRLSPSLEIEVLPAVVISLPEGRTSLFPLADKPSKLTLSAKSNLDEAIEMTASLSVTPGYAAQPDSRRFGLPPHTEQTVELAIDGSPDAPLLGEARLSVEAIVKGENYHREALYRLARGVATYREMKLARSAAAASSRRERNLVCLENEKVKATFFPSSGVFHELFRRDTGTDCLGAGDYPFGAVWYGGPSAAFKKFERGPHGVAAHFAGNYHGSRFEMTARLKEHSPFVRIDWNGGDAPVVPKTYYIMSRLSIGGTADVLTAPLTAGLLHMDWKRRHSREVALKDLALPMLAVENTDKMEVFVVVFKDIPFDSVSLTTRQASHNYMILKPNGRAPGRFTFWLGALRGGMDEAQAAVRKLIEQR